MKRFVIIGLLTGSICNCSNNADSTKGTDTANAIELPKNRMVDTLPSAGGGVDTARGGEMSGKIKGDSVSMKKDSSKR